MRPFHNQCKKERSERLQTQFKVGTVCHPSSQLVYMLQNTMISKSWLHLQVKHATLPTPHTEFRELNRSVPIYMHDVGAERVGFQQQLCLLSLWTCTMNVLFFKSDTSSIIPLMTSRAFCMQYGLTVPLATACLLWQQWTETSVRFDDIGISAFHNCVVVDLWQSLSE
jgi:hypothetical protein